MIARDGKEVHPLRQSAILRGNDAVHVQNAAHRRSWFILDLAIPGSMFIPLGSDGALVTADGASMRTYSRRKTKG